MRYHILHLWVSGCFFMFFCSLHGHPAIMPLWQVTVCPSLWPPAPMCERFNKQRRIFEVVERLLPKMRCSKCIPRAAYSCFLETVEKAWNMLYMTMQHHTQQNIILAQGAALCKRYSARQHDSPWLNTTVHCTDCRKLQYARWNH